MDDRQLINIYSDPTLTPAQKLQAIQEGAYQTVPLTEDYLGNVIATSPHVAEANQSISPPASYGPELQSYDPYVRGPVAEPAPAGGAGGTSGMSFAPAPPVPTGEGQSSTERLAPLEQRLADVSAQYAPPAATVAAPSVRQGTTTVEGGLAAKRRLGVGGGKAKGPTTPDWLRKYMGRDASAEGTVRPPPVGYTVQPLSKEGAIAIGQSEDESFAAQRAQGEAQIQSSQDIANAAVRATEDQEALTAAFVEKEHQRQEHIRGMETDYRRMADEIVDKPITDPTLWGGEDMGSQILGRIALFLGTLGSANSGQPNLVWEKMQKDVDRKIQIQKDNKALKASRLAAQGTLVDMARQRFASEAAQDQAMRQASYEKIKAQLGAYAEEAKTPERKAGLAALMAEVDKTLVVEDEQRRALMQQGELNERMARARAQARPDPLAAMVKRSGQLATLAKNQREIEGKPAAGDLTPVPLWGTSVPKELGKDAVKASGSFQNLRAEIAKYKQRRPGEAGTDAAQNRLTILLKKNAGEGFSSDKDMDLLASQIPDPSNPNFDKRMQEFEAGIAAQERSYKESVGAAESFTPTTEKK